MLDHSDATTLITVERFASQDYFAMMAELGGPGSDRLPALRRVVVVGSPERGVGDRLLADPARLAALRANARRLARPHAARNIAATLVGPRACHQGVAANHSRLEVRIRTLLRRGAVLRRRPVHFIASSDGGLQGGRTARSMLALTRPGYRSLNAMRSFS